MKSARGSAHTEPVDRATTYSMGFPPSLNLDKAMQLAGVLEDEETARKLLLRK